MLGITTDLNKVGVVLGKHNVKPVRKLKTIGVVKG